MRLLTDLLDVAAVGFFVAAAFLAAGLAAALVVCGAGCLVFSVALVRR